MARKKKRTWRAPREAKKAVKALWQKGNKWTRIALLMIVGWPLFLTAVAVLGVPLAAGMVALGALLITWKKSNKRTRVALLALTLSLAIAGIWLGGVPLATGAVALGTFLVCTVILVGWYLDPMIFVVLAPFAPGRKILRVLATVIGLELAVGVFYSIVPVHNDPALVPIFILVLLTAAFLWLGKGDGSGFRELSVATLLVIALIITLIFTVGGTKAIERRWSGVVGRATQPTPPKPVAIAPADPIPRNRVVWVNAGDPEILFDMREMEWSPWFDCEVPCTHQVKCWAPGWAEYEYTLPGGATTLRHAPDKDFKLGTMPSRRFRVRGAPGPARLYVDERR